MTVKQASVYSRDGAYFVNPDGRTTAGVWIGMTPCVRLSTGCSDTELGEAVVAALEASRTGVPHPRQAEWKLVALPLLHSAKVTSWRAFARGASFVSLRLDEDALKAMPWKADGDSFVPDPGRPEERLGTSAAELGAGVRRLLGPTGP